MPDELNPDGRKHKPRIRRPEPGWLAKLVDALPWLTRYPLWHSRELWRRMTAPNVPCHLILVVANHFEPAYNEEPNESGGFGLPLDVNTQLSRVDRWCEQAHRIGEAIRDHDGTPFRHTNFYPAEQYHRLVLDKLAALQAEGFGEVEVHLHHGVDKPDTAANLRMTLSNFRDVLAEEHKCLSRELNDSLPRYAFVHGNWALANSANGKCCGVDSEMQILAETGCYADFTLPSAPDQGQVPRINAIYQCGHSLAKKVPHRSGPNLRVGDSPVLPIIFTGPLVLGWNGRRYGIPLPKLENGALTAASLLNVDRFNLWRGARIGILGRPDWAFIKLYCHGFFEYDQSTVIGGRMQRFLEEVFELANRSGGFKVHFATAREAFNIAMAAVDGRDGEPGSYRDYRLRQIMQS